MVTPVPSSRWFWLRWSWRDLRQHWVAVLAIALVISIGTGVYAGLGSTSTWRRLTNDESFAALNMHDLRLELSPGTFAAQGTLIDAVESIEDADAIEAAAERLIVESQVEVATPEGEVMVVARIQSAERLEDAEVDGIWLRDGSSPSAVDGGAVILEAKFADFYSLPSSGALTLAGDRSVAYSGLGISPEDFYYEGPDGSLFGQGELAILYPPLEIGQRLSGRSGLVNDLVLRLGAGADRDAVAAQLEEVATDLGVSGMVTTRDDAVAYRVLYDDIENDQRFWNILAALVLAAAALAAFNLVNRIVESQRREIGIGMAIGLSRSRLAIRSLLVGVQVAILGTALGIGVGLLVGDAMGDLLETFLPMPVRRTPFQFGVFAEAAVLGLAVPILAAAVPVWRAVRVEPIEAIRTGHLTARTSRFTDWTAHLSLPGSTLLQMPIRNVLRTPRRTVLTALGVGAAITALVAVLGALDSITLAMDRTGDEFTKGDTERVVIQLDTFYPTDSDVVRDIQTAGGVDRSDVALRLPITAGSGHSGEELSLLVELVSFDSSEWIPTLENNEPLAGRSGLVLARKAADDLGVDVGDTVSVRHPARIEGIGFGMAQSTFDVAAIHVNPMRIFAYLDLGQADRFGLESMTNFVHAYPDPGADRTAVQRSVFGLSGVASSQAVARISEGFDQALEQFVGVLLIAAAAGLVLALLIAFNATRITVDERRREHATMRAFGLPVRTIIGVVVRESLLVGALATAIGIVGGLGFLIWMLRSLAATTLPDIGITARLSPTTLLVAVGVGIVSVAVAPLFLIGRIRRMSIPDTLRVME